MKMIKHTSQLFKWPQNGSGKALDQTKSAKQQAQKLWIHPPATLQNGHIAYLVKYFGNVEVSQPKGIEVVKESINKLKFIQPIKKSEGSKIPKVELTISVNGVAIQEPKSKKIYCQFPLHRISYCADDKTEKKFFSFIAKDVDTEKHLCFVFMSEKMSEEIILTIGQAFDLAYAKFIETSGRELEIRKQLIMLQKKVCELEEENKKLKERISKYEPGERDDQVKATAAAAAAATGALPPTNGENGRGSPAAAKTPDVPVPALQPPPISGRNRNNSSNMEPMVNLLDVDLESHDNTITIANQNAIANDLFDQDFNPRAVDTKALVGNSPTSDKNNSASMGITQSLDIFGCEPFQVQDPFGMSKFNSGDLDSAIVSLDKKLAEMRDGFSQGFSAGGFNMES